MDGKKEKGLPVKTRRVIAYTVFVIISILCLFWFYVLFINATRSNAELNRGFTMIPSKYAAQNFKILSMVHSLYLQVCLTVL